jgi:hypothetical protein
MADDEAAADAAQTCANKDCRIAETGRCVEGLELPDCPHYGRAVEDDTDDELTPAGIALIGANALRIGDVGRLLRAGDARLIAVVGPSDAGKTSLIASLYDLFQAGPVAGAAFARSLTLHAFEQACHDARAASRRTTPDTARTPLGEVRFYHLDIVTQPFARLTVALADRAGEEYRAAADDTAIPPTLPELMRADTITVLIDGKRLLDAGARHNVRGDAIMTLQALVDSGAARTGQRLAVVLTKLDLVEGSPQRDRALTDFEGLAATLTQKFGATFDTIGPFKIAASPESTVVARGAGVADLFAFWLGAANWSQDAAPVLAPSPRAFGRFDRNSGGANG